MTRISRNPTTHGPRYLAAKNAAEAANVALEAEAAREDAVWFWYQSFKGLATSEDDTLLHDALDLLDDTHLVEIGNRFTSAADKVTAARVGARENPDVDLF